jgi:hypothetical protein
MDQAWAFGWKPGSGISWGFDQLGKLIPKPEVDVDAEVDASVLDVGGVNLGTGGVIAIVVICVIVFGSIAASIVGLVYLLASRGKSEE